VLIGTSLTSPLYVPPRFKVVGSGMGFGGACLRALSAFVAPHNPHLGYGLCMAGQALGALSQPLFLSTPAVVAANWCVFFFNFVRQHSSTPQWLDKYSTETSTTFAASSIFYL